MHRRVSGSLVLMLVALGIGAALCASFAEASQGPKAKASPGVEFKIYPGAKTDPWTEKSAEKARKAGSDTDVYVTADAFEKVYAFYKAIAPEYQLPEIPGLGALSSADGDIKVAFFIFDAAKGLENSKHWIKIQRPTIGDVESDSRDVTSIQVVRRK